MIVVVIGKVGHVFGGRINRRNDSGCNWKGSPVYLEASLHKRLNKGDHACNNYEFQGVGHFVCYYPKTIITGPNLLIIKTEYQIRGIPIRIISCLF
jgi:hypothetical protein